MIYRYDIVETTVTHDDGDPTQHRDHPDFEPVWSFHAGSMTAKERDGWELVSVQVGSTPTIGNLDQPCTARTTITVWRQPIED